MDCYMGAETVCTQTTVIRVVKTGRRKKDSKKSRFRSRSEDGWQVVEKQDPEKTESVSRAAHNGAAFSSNTRTSLGQDSTQGCHNDLGESWDLLDSSSSSLDCSKSTNLGKCRYIPNALSETDNKDRDGKQGERNDEPPAKISDGCFTTCDSQPDREIIMGSDTGPSQNLQGNHTSCKVSRQDAAQIANTSETKYIKFLDSHDHDHRDTEQCGQADNEETGDLQIGPNVSTKKNNKGSFVLTSQEDKDTTAENGPTEIKDTEVENRPRITGGRGTYAEDMSVLLEERETKEPMVELAGEQGSKASPAHQALDSATQKPDQKYSVHHEHLNGETSIKSKENFHEERQCTTDDKLQMGHGARAKQQFQIENKTNAEQKFHMEKESRPEQEHQTKNETSRDQKLQMETETRLELGNRNQPGKGHERKQATEKGSQGPNETNSEELMKSKLQARCENLEKEVKAIKLEVQALRVSPETTRPVVEGPKHGSVPTGSSGAGVLPYYSPKPGILPCFSPKPKKQGLVWFIPEVVHKDDRLTRPLRQLADRVDKQLEIRPLPSSSITIIHVGKVILPVIAATRVGSDLNAAVQKAKLKVPAVVLIYNHLAPHMSRVRTATKDRLSDRKLVDSCQDMLDVVFWNGDMYDCGTNTKAVQALKRIWNI